MKVHIREGDIRLHDTKTRLPFKYGIATMTSAPHLFLRLRVEANGRLATGISADGLPPKWFTKDPSRPVNEEIHEMLRVIENALRLAVGLKADSAFGAWQELYDAQSAWGKSENLPPLLTQFGTSLVERALIDAICRSDGPRFHELLARGAFGVRLDRLPELAGRPPADYLPEDPLRNIIARHTVGLADPITDADIPPGERLDDDLPQSLRSCIRVYGLRHFKIKVSGDLGRDRERLRRVAAVIGADAPADYAFSLDGNEQFHALDDFRAFWDEVRRDEALSAFFPHLLFVEQPLHRSAALDPAAAPLRAWADRPPIIIDESDADLDSLPRALELGYAGTSHKNCKGVFKSVVNYCLLKHRGGLHPRQTFLMSGEDLANIGPVALLQDLAVCAALGIESVERNGHHYFAGLSMWPEDIQRLALRHHPELYHASRDGWPTLTVRGGRLDTLSFRFAPFGVGFEVPVDQFQTPDRWRHANPL